MTDNKLYVISEQALKALGVTEKFLESQEPLEHIGVGEVRINGDERDVYTFGGRFIGVSQRTYGHDTKLNIYVQKVEKNK